MKGHYLDINHENHPVLMYLDLTMYVMLALVAATFMQDMIMYNDTDDKKAFMPTIFITICTVVVSIFNLFIYETDIERENKAVMAAELQELIDMPSFEQQQASLLEGYWILPKDEGLVNSIYYYDGRGNEEVYIRNTNFSKAESMNPYELHFKDDLGYLTVEPYGVESEGFICFKDRNTIIGVANISKGIGKHKFRTIPYETMTFRLERISKKQLEQYQLEAKQEHEAL